MDRKNYCITDGALGHAPEDARAGVWGPDLLGGPTLCEGCQDKGRRHEKLEEKPNHMPPGAAVFYQ